MAELRLEHIYKTYKGGVEAVKDLNLTVANGEFLALLGPSGCGKTSTLRMIVGLEEITRGDMYIGSRRVNDLEPNQRNVALAFETYALYPPLSVRENIAFNLRAKSVPPRRDQPARAASGQRCSTSPISWTASRPSWAAARSSASRLPVRSCATRTSS